MLKVSNIVSFVLGAVVGGAASLGGYLYIVGGSGTPTTEVIAPTIVAEEIEDTSQVFRISQDESIATFAVLDDGEIVEGTTNQVAGDLLVDLTNPANTELGTMRVNLRSIDTGVGGRNRAMRADILQSSQDEFEFGTFEPTAVENIPDDVEIGTPYTFTVLGNLTLRGVTQPATFEVEATLESDTRLTGQATTTISRVDYGIGPRLPEYVADEVTLTIDLVAFPVDETEGIEDEQPLEDVS